MVAIQTRNRGDATSENHWIAGMRQRFGWSRIGATLARGFRVA